MSSKTFSTSDTAFAAYLLTSGIKLSHLDRTIPAEIAYIFKEPGNGIIGDLIFKWDTEAAECNVVKFYKSYRYLLRKIRENNV